MNREELATLLEGVPLTLGPRKKGRRSKAEIEADGNLLDWLLGLITDPTITKFVGCRDLLHPNKRIERAWGTGVFYRRRITCVDCGYAYEQNVHRGRIVWRGNQSYPTGYGKAPGTTIGRINPDVWRILHPHMPGFEFDDDAPVGLMDLLTELESIHEGADA
jgi:hypothetical protein